MKEAYYFSHDSNARHDPKTTAMRGVYGAKGYGWFWILVEMMREQDGYKLDMRSKYAFHAFASQMHCEPDEAHRFIDDCISEFGLFASDGNHFWSESLLRRMQKVEEKSAKARASSRARWGPKTAADQGSSESDDAKSSGRNANASENDALKESKANESKGNESKGEEGNAPPSKPPSLPTARPSFPPMHSENPFTIFTNHGFGELDDLTRNFVVSACEDYGDTWVIRAMTEAVSLNKKSWRYVERVLSSWKKTGHPEPWTLEKQPPGQNGGRGPGGKPSMPVVDRSADTPQLTVEEHEAMLERARRFDQNNRGGRPGAPVT